MPTVPDSATRARALARSGPWYGPSAAPVDWSQLAVTAAAACAIGVAATLAILLVVRHGRHTSAVHA